MARTSVNWSDLPIDLVSLIAEKLHVFDDILSFRSVCTTWRSVSTTESINAANRFPWMLQTKEAQGVTKKDLFDLVHNKYFESSKFSHEFKTLCLGWKGWVLAVKKRGTMCLLHAFKSSKSVSLPDKKSLQERRYDRITVCKAVLSADPFTNQSDYILVIIYDGAKGNGKLAFWRPGDKIYTKVSVHSSRVHDIAFHGSQLYAVTGDSVIVFDVAGFELAFTYQLKGKLPSFGIFGDWQLHVMDYYLVELDRELVLLRPSRNDPWSGGINKAMKFNLYSVSGGWNEIKDLGNKAIFIGTNQSFALDDASEIPGCRPNHIYFAALTYGGCGLYNLTNARVECLDCNPSEYWYSCPRSSLWVQPTFD